MNSKLIRRLLLSLVAIATLGLAPVVAGADTTGTPVVTYTPVYYGFGYLPIDYLALLDMQAMDAQANAIRDQMDRYRAWREQEHEAWQRWVDPIGSWHEDMANLRHDYYDKLFEQHRLWADAEADRMERFMDVQEQWLTAFAPPPPPPPLPLLW